ncbi:MAG: NEW3 domain-containing protein [Defluviitaleaceae bacterium]|nr:NEW3 domain-containing protein [Defluviitaleaceae bacterium]MCL2274971.1 NEW3 domain-containing protein [Defluviitaleaceae bacterium]
MKTNMAKKMAAWLLIVSVVIAVMAPIPVQAFSREELELQWLIAVQNDNLALATEIRAMIDARFPATPPPTPPPPTPQVFDPRISLLNPQSVTIAPGDSQVFVLTLRNTGVGTASEIVTSAGTSGPLILEIVENGRIATMAQNNERTLSLRITARADAAPGSSYTITLNHDFRTAAPATRNNSTELTVHIGGEAGHAPNVRLSNPRISQTAPIRAGQSFSVAMELENFGGSEAREVQITVEGIGRDTFSMASHSTQLQIANIGAGQQRTVQFDFTASMMVDTAFHELVFTAVARDAQGREITSHPMPFFVTTDAVDTFADLEIRTITAPSGQTDAGATANFTLELHNRGEIELTQISVTAHPPTQINHRSQDTRTISSLRPGESQQVSFSFSPSNAAGNYTHTIRFAAEYHIRGAATQPPVVNQFAALNVNNPHGGESDDMTDRPWLIVENFSVDPQIAQAGQEFTMGITFRNTSPTHSIHSARIIFTPQGAGPQGDVVFIPVGGSSNTVFVDYIPPGGTVDKEMTFFTVGDAVPRSYTMRVSKDYQSPGFPSGALSEYVDLSIRVAQFVRLETVQDFWMPGMVNVNDPIRIEFQVINSGRVTLHNVRVRVEEHNHDPNFPLIDTSEANLPVGEMQPSRWLMYTGLFRPLAPGFLTGDIIIYGEDPAFELVEHRIPFEVYVQDWGGDMWNDPWGNDPWGDDPWNDPWGNDSWGNDPWEEEELGFFRRVWRWLTTPLGGYAGHRRNNGNGQQDMFNQPQFWGDAGYENGSTEGFEFMRQVVVTPGGGGAVMISPPRPGGGMVVSPGGGMMDPWGEPMEAPRDSFFINVWNFVRMPIFLFPFGLAAGAGITLLVIKIKKRQAAEMDFDE